MLNWFDVLLLVIVVVSVIRGVGNGFVRGIFGFLGIGFGIWFAKVYGEAFSTYLEFFLPISMKFVRIISFVVLFLGVVVGFNFAGIGVKKLLVTIQLDWLDSVGGGLLGFVLSFLWISLLLTLIVFLPVPQSWKVVVHKSYIVTMYINNIPYVVNFLGRFITADFYSYLVKWQQLLVSGI